MKDKYRGVIFGIAIGDALGAPVEGLRSYQIQDIYGCVNNYINLPLAPTKDYPKPQAVFRLSRTYTDDTQNLLIGLAHLIKHNSQFNKKAMIQELCDAFPYLRGIGKQTREVIRAYRHNKEPPISPFSPPSNSLIFRGLPFMIFKDSDFTEIREVSQITHKNLSSSLGTYFYGNLIKDLLSNKDEVDSVRLRIAQISELLCKYKSSITSSEEEHSEYLISNLEKVLELSDFSDEFCIGGIGTSSRVYHSLPVAIHAFLTHENFTDGVFKAINLGGDSDSIGALTGGLFGALNGLSSIDWNLRNLRNCDNIDQVIREILDTKTPRIYDFVESEKRLTFEETAMKMHIKRTIAKEVSKYKGIQTKINGHEIIALAKKYGYNLPQKKLGEIKRILKDCEIKDSDMELEEERSIVLEWLNSFPKV